MLSSIDKCGGNNGSLLDPVQHAWQTIIGRFNFSTTVTWETDGKYNHDARVKWSSCQYWHDTCLPVHTAVCMGWYRRCMHSFSAGKLRWAAISSMCIIGHLVAHHLTAKTASRWTLERGLFAKLEHTASVLHHRLNSIGIYVMLYCVVLQYVYYLGRLELMMIKIKTKNSNGFAVTNVTQNTNSNAHNTLKYSCALW